MNKEDIDVWVFIAFMIIVAIIAIQNNTMKQTDKQRRQISQFSEWLTMQENEKLLKMGSSPIIPHDPPNAEENKQPSGLKIDNYGSFK